MGRGEVEGISTVTLAGWVGEEVGEVGEVGEVETGRDVSVERLNGVVNGVVLGGGSRDWLVDVVCVVFIELVRTFMCLLMLVSLVTMVQQGE
jgi:hypothetical protein